VVGRRSGDGFLWRDGRITDLGSLGGGYTQVQDVNNRDEVVGWSFLADGSAHAFLWRRGIMTDLGVLPGGTHSYAYGINDRGDVVGTSETAGNLHAVVWHDGVVADLGGDRVGDYAMANDINAAGQIAGEWGDGNYGSLAVRWQHGRRLLLSTATAIAKAINDRGHIVGSFAEDWSYEHGFLWRHGTITPIEPPAGMTTLIVADLNNRDQVVGTGFNGYISTDAVVWQDGRTTVLPKLGGTAEAAAINHRGQVAGYSTTTPTGTDTRAVLWTR
jgi:probable HAF family extracellular repeat protein